MSYLMYKICDGKYLYRAFNEWTYNVHEASIFDSCEDNWELWIDHVSAVLLSNNVDYYSIKEQYSGKYYGGGNNWTTRWESAILFRGVEQATDAMRNIDKKSLVGVGNGHYFHICLQDMRHFFKLARNNLENNLEMAL